MAVVKIGAEDTNQTLSSYSVVEDSTPVDISDTSGGVSQITLAVRTEDGWKSYRKKTAVVTDLTQGVTSGIITDATNTWSNSTGDGTVTVTANSVLSKLAVIRTAQPFQGTLSAAILYYLSLVGITSNIVIDDGIASVPVVFQGWQGDVYLYLTKMLGPAYQFEVSLVGQNIVCRPFRTRTAVSYRESGVAETITSANPAQSVQIDWYSSQYKTGALAYPPGGWTADTTVYQVDAGQTVTIDDIPLITDGGVGASITSISQPVCVLSVDRNYSATSVYAIAGNDGLPITPAQWKATGGSLTLTINEDTKSLSMVLTGSNITQYAPYRVAMSSGSSNYYSSLRIVGTGVFTVKNNIILNTGLSTDDAPQVIGTEVDSPFITSLAQAYDRGIWTVARYSGLNQTLNVQSAGINRIDDSGSYDFPTIADFNAAYVGQTIAQFDTAWAGQTIQEFDDYWDSTVADRFSNQAFGNIGGARVPRDDLIFRIRSATNSQGNIAYTAEMDTTIADFNAVWVNKTIADFNDFWYQKTVQEFDVSPLRRPAQTFIDPRLVSIYDFSHYDDTPVYG